MRQKINRFVRILKTREKLREEEQIILGHQKQEENAVLKKLSELDDEKKSALESFLSLNDEGGFVSCQEMWYSRQVLDVIDKHISEKKVCLTTVRKKIADTESRLVERHRDVKIMDKYIDNLSETMNTTIMSLEQMEIDDIATIRFEPKEEL